MEPKAPIIAVDSDIFVRDLRYLRDRDYGVNRQFLESLRTAKNGVTTLYNLLEICGILSFNLNPRQLKELYFYFPQRYAIGVVPEPTLRGVLPELDSAHVFERILSPMSLGDALIAGAIEKYLPEAELFISWNARHFKLPGIRSMTPRQFLAGR